MLPEPCITRDDAKGLWRLESEILAPSLGFVLVVPKGFESDLASIPRALWSVMAPFELSCIAPLVHDWLYEHGGRITTAIRGPSIEIRQSHTFSRADADRFLLDLMTQEGVPSWRRRSAYYAVRWFGKDAWQA